MSPVNAQSAELHGGLSGFEPTAYGLPEATISLRFINCEYHDGHEHVRKVGDRRPRNSMGEPTGNPAMVSRPPRSGPRFDFDRSTVKRR